MKNALQIVLVSVLAGSGQVVGGPSMTMPEHSKLVFEEDWSTGRIDPDKWYALHKRWGEGNHGVVRQNVFLATDAVDGQKKNVLVCRGHGDRYEGPVVGWHGNATRVGGVIVSKPFFASGRYDVVLKIGHAEDAPGCPEDPRRPIGMVPAIWTYAYRWVGPDGSPPSQFNRSSPLYNPHLRNEYWSEIDMPELGKAQSFESGLYNTFLNVNHQSRKFSTAGVADGKYHTFTSIWRTHLLPLDGVTDRDVVESEGYWWIQNKAIPFPEYRGNPLKRVGANRYQLYAGKEVTHFIDGRHVGTNQTHVPAMAAQLTIGVWFPAWGGAAPWAQSRVSIASVKVWQYDDPGDVRGVLTDDVPAGMDAAGTPLE